MVPASNANKAERFLNERVIFQEALHKQGFRAVVLYRDSVIAIYWGQYPILHGGMIWCSNKLHFTSDVYKSLSTLILQQKNDRTIKHSFQIQAGLPYLSYSTNFVAFALNLHLAYHSTNCKHLSNKVLKWTWINIQFIDPSWSKTYSRLLCPIFITSCITTIHKYKVIH